MNNQNNDAAISDTDLVKVSGGFFGVIYQTFRKHARKAAETLLSSADRSFDHAARAAAG